MCPLQWRNVEEKSSAPGRFKGVVKLKKQVNLLRGILGANLDTSKDEVKFTCSGERQMQDIRNKLSQHSNKILHGM